MSKKRAAAEAETTAKKARTVATTEKKTEKKIKPKEKVSWFHPCLLDPALRLSRGKRSLSLERLSKKLSFREIPPPSVLPSNPTISIAIGARFTTKMEPSSG